ncbi:uncharacterized protein LOC107270473 isoform X2 [Cephus cinctus]|uniref:Uncharacterized protein LOC107270473 isoform X2 n=1 Tax=Cephus cinctus TaxID=211228 RepID=A0AAJ7C3J2_CEPCN|nr:uncharacterized protein LOC107270473 isoform X2 [Cephus cinctus]
MLKAVLYLAVLGLMVQWTQIMGNPGDRRSIRPQLYSEQQYEINKNDPRSDWFYSRSSRSLPPFSWSFFKDEDDEDTLIKKRLDTLEKKQKELVELMKKLQQGPTTKGCAPCPETKKEEKPTCVPTIAKQGEKEEVPQKDKVPSTPSVSSPTVTNTENTTDKKKDDGTEKPVIKGPEETEEKKPEEPPKEIND